MESFEYGTTAHKLSVSGIKRTWTDQPFLKSGGQVEHLKARVVELLWFFALLLLSTAKILLMFLASNAQIDRVCFTRSPLICRLSNSGHDDELMMPESKWKFLACFSVLVSVLEVSREDDDRFLEVGTSSVPSSYASQRALIDLSV